MLNVAIVGLGHYGQRLVDSVNGISQRVRVTHAVAPRPEKARAFAAAKGVMLSADYAAVLADPSIAGIVSCGPAHLHARHSLQALEAGKHVLGVKPMALAGADARALQEAAQARGLVMAMGYDRCFMPNVARLRAEIAAGALGDLLHAQGSFCVHRYHRIKPGDWKGDPANAPPGGLADHMLYHSIETLGAVEEVFAAARHDVTDNALADSTAVLLRMRNGASATLTGIGATAQDQRFQIFGSKGWAETRGSRDFRLRTTQGREVEESLPDHDAQRAEMEAFADAATGAKAFPVPLADAVHGVAALEAMARSAQEGRVVRVAG